MRISYSVKALSDLGKIPQNIVKTFYKQVLFLETNLRHPSLRAKKYDESRDLWQARVNQHWRFYFTIKDEEYYIEEIIPHPK